MDYLLLFLIIIAAAFILPELAKKIHIPYVTTIIFAGILLGPFGFKILDLGEITGFLAAIGAVFLMFTAGLDVKLSSLRRIGMKTTLIAVINGLIPAVVGFLIGHFFNLGLLTSLILSAIFISSSVAIVMPSLKETQTDQTDLGKVIISSTVAQDTFSLLLLAFLLKYANPNGFVSFPIYVPLVLGAIVALYFLIPYLQKFFIKKQITTQKEDVFEGEFRFIVFVLIVTAVIFEVLGLHAAIAGFFVGLFLSDAIKGRLVYEKIYTISYGLFIPIFFLIVGMRTDFISIFAIQENLILTLFIVFGLIISKFFSGLVAGLIAGYDKNNSLLIAASCVPQLSTTLVVALAASQFGLFNEQLVSSIVVLSIVSTTITPFLMKYFNQNILNAKKAQEFSKSKKTWGVTKEVKQIKAVKKQVKQKETTIKKEVNKSKQERISIEKKKKKIQKIKKVIRKKNK